jgi:hypothetical protein
MLKQQFCQDPLCGHLFHTTPTPPLMSMHACWDSVTSKLLWPQTQEEQTPVYKMFPEMRTRI